MADPAPAKHDPLAVHPAPWRRFAALYRVKLRPRWRETRPLILIALFLAVLILGTIGYHERFEKQHYSFFDSFYRALLLFGLGGTVDPPVPTTLQIARVMAPLLTGLAAIQGLISLSREQLQLFGLRMLLRDHVVVAGLGDAGFRLATALHEAGLRVVALEQDPNNPAIAGCRERGISVLRGDAADSAVLERARVGRARHLLVTCGEDGKNVDVADVARTLTPPGRSGPLTVLVQLEDLGLWRALQAQTLRDASRGDYRLELFNLFAAASRMALDMHPPPWGQGESASAVPVLVVGLEGMGENLVLNLAGLWLRARTDRAERLPVTLVGPDSPRQRDQLLGRYSQLGQVCDLGALEVDLDSAELPGQPAVQQAAAAYVTLVTEADALAAGLSVAEGAGPDAPVVVGVADESAGVARALRDSGPANVHGFGVLSRTLRPELLLQGTNEALAKAKHEQYLRDELGKGATLGSNPSLVSWEELPESLKESNRRFAEGIGEKLIAAGLAVVPDPLIDPRGPLLSFTDDEVEELAKLEHDRWAGDLKRDGWRYHDAPKDPKRKLHPLLVEWDQLAEVEREKDREPVRALPQMLAQEGFELYRPAHIRPRALEKTAA